MRLGVIIAFLLVLGIGVGFSYDVYAQENSIPAWVKGVANFWVEGNISDDEFLEAIEFLIISGYISVNIEVVDENFVENTNENDEVDEYYDNEYFEDEEYFEVESDYYENPYFPENRKNTQIGEEYWSCYQDEPASKDCLSYDEKYFLGIDTPGLISGYYVTCDPTCKLTLDFHEEDIDEKLVKFQSGTLYQEIFDVYVTVTPQVILDKLNYFSLSSDDYYGIESAATYIDVEDTTKMELSVDPVDAAPNGTIDKQFLKSLLIHENAHMFSLITSQGDGNWLDAETDAEMRSLFKVKQTQCAPNYYTDMTGCMNDESYLNLFFQEFWLETYKDYQWSFEFDTDEAFWNYEDAFIKKYEDQFINTYAMSFVEEDFAESFTAFVLLDEPTGDSIVDQKILFFYDFAEIVEMRDYIRNNL